MPAHLSETTGSQRLAYALGAALASIAATGWLDVLDWRVRMLLGWCAGIGVYLLLAWWLCHSFDAARTRARAQAQDEPSVVIFLLLLLANLACLAAIALMMQDIDDVHGWQRAGLIALLGLALAVSWLFIQVLFTFHYAHRYYQGEKPGRADGPGLAFPGERDPDYFDFLYFAHVIGMTSQVSDVKTTSTQMRRITMIHSVLAFGFNMLIFALSINVVAGLLR